MSMLLEKLLEVTLSASAIALMILLFRRLFRKNLSPKLQYGIWLLLMLRLMTPASLDTGFHVDSLLPEQPVAVQQSTPPARPASNVVQTGSPPAGAEVPDAQPNPAPSGTPAYVQARPAAAEPAAPPWDWQTWAICLWLSGMVAFAAGTIVLKHRFNRSVRAQAVRAEPHVLSEFEGCKRLLSVRRAPRLLVTQREISPALMVLRGRAVVILPEFAARDAETLHYALTHELAHYVRRDHILCLILGALRCAYWFNPLLHFAFTQLQADMETACDARVLTAIPATEKRAYLVTLLRMFTRPAAPALSMARFRTRKLAQRRIEGAFMKAAAPLSIKVIATLMAALLLLLCFTTACQPTPEKPAVVNKSDGKLEQKIEADPVESNEPHESPAPERLNDTYSKGILTINYDADMEVPTVDAYPVLNISSAWLTQQQVDAFVRAIVGDRQLYEAYVPITKAQFQEEMIEVIAGFRNGTMSFDEGETEENLRAHYEALIAQAPEVAAEKQPIDTTLVRDDNTRYEEYRMDAEVDMGGSERALFWVMNSMDNIGFIRYDNRTVPPGNPVTTEQAQAVAEQLIEDMGIEDMTAAYCLDYDSQTLSQEERYRVQDEQRRAGGQSSGVRQFVFMRSVNGVPSTYTSYTPGVMNEEYTPFWNLETIVVELIGDVVRFVEWNGNIKINKTENENVELLPFETILETANEQISYQRGSDASLASLTFDISRVTLGYARIRVKDTADEYRLVPVWDFFGTYTEVYDLEKSSEEIQNMDFLTEAEKQQEIDRLKNSPTYVNDWNKASIITINAIDGTVIDRQAC